MRPVFISALFLSCVIPSTVLAQESVSFSSEDIDAALRDSLDWLVRHQSPDGGWRARDFGTMCEEPCSPVDRLECLAEYTGDAAYDIGVTALAVLAFAEYGHTHQDGRYPAYVDCLGKAVVYLKDVQIDSVDPNVDGRFGSGDPWAWIYNHAITTTALARLLVLSGDAEGLEPAVTDAVRLCLRAQNSGFGWRYGIQPADNDTSVTGWMTVALSTARKADLSIPQEDYTSAFNGALEWFRRATSPGGRTGYNVPGDEGALLVDDPCGEPFIHSQESSEMTAVALAARLLLGVDLSSAPLRGSLDLLAAEPPRWVEKSESQPSRVNFYYWYYGARALLRLRESRDAIYDLWHLMGQRRGFPCQKSADVNDDAELDLSDVLALLLWLFEGQPAPPLPGPRECGPDPTPDAMTCHSSAACD